MSLKHQKHRPRKRFGQNFLQDATIIQRIVDAVEPAPGDCVVEIGPGLGALTAPLLSRVSRLHVVELDRDLVARLTERGHDPEHLTVHQADALTFDFEALHRREASEAPFKIVGNLPYNISTPLILRLLQQIRSNSRWIFMLQEEVVDRLVAEPGCKDYGRLSVMVQYHCAVDKLFTVSNQAFYPVPKVQSAVVALKPHAVVPYPARDFSVFSQLVQKAFNQRRKTLQNSLKGVISPDLWTTLGIDPMSRPEQLTLAQFVALSNALSEAGGQV